MHVQLGKWSESDLQPQKSKDWCINALKGQNDSNLFKNIVANDNLK